MLQLFCVITTGAIILINVPLLLLGIEVWFSPEYALYLPANILLTLLPTLLFAGGAIESMRGAILRQVIHFILTASIFHVTIQRFYMFGGWRGWQFLILAFFLMCYILGNIIFWVRARKVADEVNKKLRERHVAENIRHKE